MCTRVCLNFDESILFAQVANFEIILSFRLFLNTLLISLSCACHKVNSPTTIISLEITFPKLHYYADISRLKQCVHIAYNRRAMSHLNGMRLAPKKTI